MHRVIKHSVGNWTIILSNLAASGPMTMAQLQQQLCLIRHGRWDARRDRGYFSWYFSTTKASWCHKMGLDYGYIERLPRDENGFVCYQITEKGHLWLTENHGKTTHGSNWR